MLMFVHLAADTPRARWRTRSAGRTECLPTPPVSCSITLSDNQGRLETAAEGGAGRRHAKNAAAPMDQSREAHHSARPLHSPEGGHEPDDAQGLSCYSR